MRSASKLPPLPRKFSLAVYETFLEHSETASGGKVLEGKHWRGGTGWLWPPQPHHPSCPSLLTGIHIPNSGWEQKPQVTAAASTQVQATVTALI